MKMGKYMKLKICEKHRIHGYIDFTIEEQTHTGKKFGANGTDSFLASNGITLSSMDCPEWRQSTKILFVRGCLSDRDDDIVTCEIGVYDLIYDAVGEYNTAFMGLDLSLDKELFEI